MIRTNFTIIPIPICSANDPLQNLKNSCCYNLALVKHVSCCGAQRFLPGAARWAHGWPDPTAPRCQPCCEKGQRQVVMKKNITRCPCDGFLLCFRRARWWQESQMGWSTFCRLDHILWMPNSSAVVFYPFHFATGQAISARTCFSKIVSFR